MLHHQNRDKIISKYCSMMEDNEVDVCTGFQCYCGFESKREERKSVPFSNHPKMQLLRGTQILILMVPQIRRLKADQGLDHSVTEIPRYFTMDHGNIFLSEKSM